MAISLQISDINVLTETDRRILSALMQVNGNIGTCPPEVNSVANTQQPPAADPAPAVSGEDEGSEVEALAAEGVTVDSRGVPHDPRIHSAPPKLTSEGRWRAKRNVDKDLLQKVEGEYLAAVKGAGVPPPSASQQQAGDFLDAGSARNAVNQQTTAANAGTVGQATAPALGVSPVPQVGQLANQSFADFARNGAGVVCDPPVQAPNAPAAVMHPSATVPDVPALIMRVATAVNAGKITMEQVCEICQRVAGVPQIGALIANVSAIPAVLAELTSRGI